MLRTKTRNLAQPVLSFRKAMGIAKRTGTPFLALCVLKLRQNVKLLREALPGVRLFYAMKSNPDPNVLIALQDVVDGIDVASYGEVRIADATGYGPERLIHTNPVKKREEIQECIEHGVRLFVFDTQDEVEKFREFRTRSELLLRIAIPKVTCAVNLSSKFGVQEADVRSLLASARRAGLRVRGITFHVGSQCKDPRDYSRALEFAGRAFDLGCKLGFRFDTLDIGGGLPIPYRTPLPDLWEYFSAIRGGLSNTFPKTIQVLAEPGRCIVGDSMTLVVSVLGRTLRKGVRWYYIDDGLYGGFSGKLYDNCDYRLLPSVDGPRENCVVAGRSCDSIDVVSRDQPMPRLQVGDLLLVPGVGAYATANATSFNGFPPPPVVVLGERSRAGKVLNNHVIPGLEDPLTVRSCDRHELVPSQILEEE